MKEATRRICVVNGGNTIAVGCPIQATCVATFAKGQGRGMVRCAYLERVLHSGPNKSSVYCSYSDC